MLYIHLFIFFFFFNGIAAYTKIWSGKLYFVILEEREKKTRKHFKAVFCILSQVKVAMLQKEGRLPEHPLSVLWADL